MIAWIQNLKKKVVVEKPAAERKKIGDVLSAHYVFADLQAKTIQVYSIDPTI